MSPVWACASVLSFMLPFPRTPGTLLALHSHGLGLFPSGSIISGASYALEIVGRLKRTRPPSPSTPAPKLLQTSSGDFSALASKPLSLGVIP